MNIGYLRSAAQVARIAALLDTGFVGSLLTDPVIVGDISGNRRVNAGDASRVAQFASLIDVPEIPPIPAGVFVTGAERAQIGLGLPGVVITEKKLSRRSPHPTADGDSADRTDHEAISAIAGENPHPAPELAPHDAEADPGEPRRVGEHDDHVQRGWTSSPDEVEERGSNDER